MQKNKNSKSIKSVETITHDEATPKNIPTAEFQSLLHKTEENPIRVAYEPRNRDLDLKLACYVVILIFINL